MTWEKKNRADKISGASNLALGLIFLMALVPATLPGAVLKAGTARVGITPPPGLPMYGYMERTQPATGTLDPLWARVLVLEAEGRRVAIVTLDLGRTFGPASLARLREAVKHSSGIAFLLVTASHTLRDNFLPGKVPRSTKSPEPSKKPASAWWRLGSEPVTGRFTSVITGDR